MASQPTQSQAEKQKAARERERAHLLAQTAQLEKLIEELLGGDDAK